MNEQPPTEMRTHFCGDLRPTDVGRTVSVCGWVARRREHGEHLAFVDLRDHTGIIQCVVDGAHDLRSEYVLRVTGTVRPRPDGTVNANLATGEVEVGDCEVEVLAQAEPPPFPLDDRAAEVDETVRLRHRYVDLRRDEMQRNLRTRAKVNGALRLAMDAQGFVEVETPMLIASTPEGARDFVVPSRHRPGTFYALPQSPQLFKQLCMVGGIDRYYQIARCMRDEDLRADRQFEFSQLDAEMSFAGQEDVLACITTAVAAAVESVTGERIGEIPRMTWQQAMDRYGSDKPDIRFGMELVELTDVFGDTGLQRLQGCVGQGHPAGRRVRGHQPEPARRPDRLGQALGGQGPGLDAGGGRATAARSRSTRPWPSSCPPRSRPHWPTAWGRRTATCCSSWPTSGPGWSTSWACSAWSWAGPR